MLRLHPTQNWETPYEFDTNGFTEKWWHSINITETIADQQENDYWSFRENDTEIVRVWLEKATSMTTTSISPHQKQSRKSSSSK